MNNRAITNLTQQLQKSLDSNYDVVDMETVLYVIQTLEKTTITKEQLETTRLARYINELRRRTTSETLARRAKSLLKKWRDIFIQPPAAGAVIVVPTAPTSTARPPQRQIMAGAVVGAKQPQPQPATTSSVTSGSKIISTGSANNNSNCSNSNSKTTPNSLLLSNGGAEKKRPIVSNNASSGVAAGGGAGGGGGGKAAIAASSTTSSQYQNQPTSFANVLGGGVGVVASTQQQQQLLYDRHRQSPITASMLDLDSNHSRSHQMSSSKHLRSSASLHNGDLLLLHDSNSISMDITDGGGGGPDDHHSKRYASGAIAPTTASAPATVSTTGGAPTIDAMCSSSSNHRKSKKHKKDKKKKSPDKPPPTSDTTNPAVPALSTTTKSKAAATTTPATGLFLNQYNNEDVVPSVVFPPHDSLSSSSMSRFPSNISTNTMTMPNSSRLMANNNNEAKIGGSGESQHGGAPSESDLTFAGKFKSSTTTTTSLGSGSEQLISVPLKKSCSDSKDSSDVVVVESRSSSPFITAPRDVTADDSCSSMINDLAMYGRSLMAVKGKNAQRSSGSTTTTTTAQPLIGAGVVLDQSDQSSNGPTATVMTIDQTSQHQVPGAALATHPKQSVDASASAPATPAPGPKKRGRKKGSRGFDSVIAQTHTLLTMFERPRLLPGGKKVKTTKELLADIQSRKLGSSATSSPTLLAATSRQSVSPSTCSEASFQSDVTNTRASSLLNTRSSPDLGSNLTNCRQSDIEDGNSATDSNEAFSSRLPAKTSRGAAIAAATMTSSSVATVSSVDEYLISLFKQLPPIDFTPLTAQIESNGGEIVCTCTVREVEPVKEEVVIVKTEGEDNDDNEVVDREHEHKVTVTVPPPPIVVKKAPVPLAAVADSPTPPPAPAKKPVKSIFDLDYDEDNDPLHSFVEAAKLRTYAEPEETSSSAVAVVPLVLPPAHHHSNSNSRDSLPIEQSTSSIPNGTTTATTTSSSLSSVAPLTSLAPQPQPPPLPPMPVFPIYEVVEDPDCPAKYRYEIQTNRITEHHLNMLHNCYVENVNGNWNAPVPMTAEHRKRLRRYLSAVHHRLNNKKKKKQKEEEREEPRQHHEETDSLAAIKTDNWWTTDAKFRQLIGDGEDGRGSSDDETLYERVVPHYDHIIMDQIVKNLSHVKFTRNYMNRKLRRLKKKLKREEEEARGDDLEEEAGRNLLTGVGATDEEGGADGVGAETERTTTNKRRRRGLGSSHSSSSDDEEENDVDKDKHKHQRRKKHRKIHDTTSSLERNDTIVDISISRNELKDRLMEQSPQSPPNPSHNDDHHHDEDNDAGTFQLISKPNRFSDTTDNACDVDLSSTTNNHHRPHNQQDDEEDVVVALMEPSSNSSTSCTSPINNNVSEKISDSNRMESETIAPPTAAVPIVADDDDRAGGGDNNDDEDEEDVAANDTNSHDDSYYSEDDDDEYDDDDDDDDEEDYDEDNDEEHEVVTHDMTSSTSTTSQQHIVLTIKKKIPPKSASSHHHIGGSLDDGHEMTTTTTTNNEQQLSIITSLTKPTTIKIRRKNNNQVQLEQQQPQQQQQQPELQEPINPINEEAETTMLIHRNTISSNHDYVLDEHHPYVDENNFLDNNNVKTDLGGGGGVTDAANKDRDIADADDKKSIIMETFVHDSIDEHKMPIDVLYDQAGPEEFVAVDNAARENHIREGSDLIVKMEIEEEEAATEEPLKVIEDLARNNSCDNDNNRPPATIEEESSSSLSTASDEDPEQLLPKHNNGLLMSFNRLGDDSLTGLRVVGETTTTAATEEQLPQQPDEVTAVVAAATTTTPINRDIDDYQIEEFKEWHQLLQVPSYNNELLTILPYVVID